jgi:hypothetical protein
MRSIDGTGYIAKPIDKQVLRSAQDDNSFIEA